MTYDEIMVDLSNAVANDSDGEQWILLAAEQEGFKGYGWIMAADFLANKGVTWQRIVNRHK